MQDPWTKEYVVGAIEDSLKECLEHNIDSKTMEMPFTLFQLALLLEEKEEQNLIIGV